MAGLCTVQYVVAPKFDEQEKDNDIKNIRGKYRFNSPS